MVEAGKAREERNRAILKTQQNAGWAKGNESFALYPMQNWEVKELLPRGVESALKKHTWIVYIQVWFTAQSR